MHERKPSFQPAAIALTIAAAFLRLIPHPANFTPIGGTALFGGARLKGWQAYAIPLLAMLITDPIVSHMAGFPAYSKMTVIIYLSFLVYVVLGRTLLRNAHHWWQIGTVAVAGSVQFFLLTNFFVWWDSGVMYPHTWAGLMACYLAALPFFGRTLLSDVFYSLVLFAAYAVLGKRFEHQPRAVQA